MDWIYLSQQIIQELTMRNLLFTILLLLSSTVFAQEIKTSEAISQNLEIEIQVLDFKQAENKINDLISETNSTVENSSRNTNESSYKNIRLKILTNKAGFQKYLTELPNLGSISKNIVTTTNKNNEVENMDVELNYLKKQRDLYSDELKSIDKMINKTAYENFWNKSREFDERIFRIEKSILESKQETRNYSISIMINEFHAEPLDSYNFQWVNMPGFEVSYLNIENPKLGLSSSGYRGAGVKYLFSKGKSYFVLSVLKSSDQVSDSTQIRDMFLYGYGVDFYPRYFGRGQREFFNLYSGLNFGGIYMTGTNSSHHVGYISPYLGLEIYKNQFVLLDFRSGYLIPMDQSTNLNFRGLTSHLSFNFVF